MKLAKCKWCGRTPVMETVKPALKIGRSYDLDSPCFRVVCSCGAHSWGRSTKEGAALIWGGDSKGNGYQQLGPPEDA